MAIQYYIGDRLVGLPSDTKPTTIRDGAFFTETGAPYYAYIKTSGQWIPINSGISGGSVVGGNGNMRLSVTGSNFFSGDISLTGIGGAQVILSGNNIILISGVAGGQGAPGGSAGVLTLNSISGNLTLSGAGNITIQNSGASTIFISGDVSNLATLSNLESTGLALGNSIRLVSGNLTATGQTLNSRIISLSGDLALTGSNLNTRIDNWGVKTINSISGNVVISGVLPIIATASGSNIIWLSGDIATATNLGLTGSNLNARIISLSGDLYSTGNTLNNKINSLSGYSNNTFATIIALNNWGVKSLNNISGDLRISGAGNISIQNSGSSTIFISGDTSSFVTSSTLESTGLALGNSIRLVSGNLTTTGLILNSRIISLSGDLFTTGSILNNRIDLISGNLTQTGINLINQLYSRNNPSGFITGDLYWTRTGTNTILRNYGDRVGIGTGVPSGFLHLYGTDNSIQNCPSILFQTNQDQYPNFQVFPISHDNITLNFDAFYNGRWTSSDNTINAQIGKFASSFRVGYAPGVTEGNEITWSYPIIIKNGTGGLVGINNVDNPKKELHINGTTLTSGISIVSGASNGYVLTSNANGDGTWQPNIAGGNPFTVTGISITGSVTQTGLVNFSGIGGTQVILTGNNTILISGGGGAGSTTTNNYYINTGIQSGEFDFIPNYQLVGDAFTWTNMPAALTEFGGTLFRKFVNFSNATGIRLQTVVSTVGGANGTVYLQYSHDNSTWNTLISGTEIRLGSAGMKMTNWSGIPTGVFNTTTGVHVRAVGFGGDGALDPQFRNISFDLMGRKPSNITSLRSTIKTISGNYTLTNQDQIILANPPTTGHFILTLPNVSTVSGIEYRIKLIRSSPTLTGFLYITGTSSQLIDNEPHYMLVNRNEAASFIGDTENSIWRIF